MLSLNSIHIRASLEGNIYDQAVLTATSAEQPGAKTYEKPEERDPAVLLKLEANSQLVTRVVLDTNLDYQRTQDGQPQIPPIATPSPLDYQFSMLPPKAMKWNRKPFPNADETLVTNLMIQGGREPIKPTRNSQFGYYGTGMIRMRKVWKETQAFN
ncbi:hypothetical protein HD806DRAFT_136673 [Xylariaceae sp. AK1471]|nr:hypothetical protein HD806DRAFT_136673 [Xylariaceae sp. AK1471]